MLEKTLESPFDCKEIQPVKPKGNQPWIFPGRTGAEAPIFWPSDAKSDSLKTLWCWERLKAGREGDDRGWDGWMVSPTWWTWVWASSGKWWRTGKPGVLQSIGSQELDTNERLNSNRPHKDIHQSPRMRASWKEDSGKPTKILSTEVSLLRNVVHWGRKDQLLQRLSSNSSAGFSWIVNC